jgi:hypothetical protein
MANVFASPAALPPVASNLLFYCCGSLHPKFDVDAVRVIDIH